MQPSDGASVPYHGLVKRSVMIAGHSTSISLEPFFWQNLEQAALKRDLPLNALIARIDAERVKANDIPNLASALRIWLFFTLWQEKEALTHNLLNESA
ncbi:MAG: ribbon-helix-helix domain-containing protein [Zymomonas mobilis]|uniref:Ribbon-helix-helix protein n=1 Tax=Zymomonas mobilis TaxID=542 RepID=A0A542VZQ5_ZYMMB|nr:ribbon-helix-helix domain-containing protein [Zymomonas mobilis]TQL16814.1 ribbon-helix-helix protein [Zymomonas mobilis]